jgi:hypothetical protein
MQEELKLARLAWLKALTGRDPWAYYQARRRYLVCMQRAQDWLDGLKDARLHAFWVWAFNSREAS